MADLTDWRLPTVRELAFIRKIVYATGACINLDCFPNTKADYYFTSDISYVDVNQRVVVNFDSSGVYYDWMNTLTYVQAVRGEYFVNEFIDNSDGTISDRSTGLMWLKDGSCLGDRTWQAALDTVYDLNNSPGSFTCVGYNALRW